MASSVSRIIAERQRLVEATEERLSKATPQQRQDLIRLMQPRITEPYMPHIPHPKQQVFLALNAREVGFGGAAGGGKSDALLLAALQYVDVPGYSALILRRTWPDLIQAGAIMDRANQWLRNTDAKSHEGGRWWTFPSGARLSFGYMQRASDRERYQSAEFQFVGFDECTQFQELQYTFLFSRMRKPSISCLNCRTSLGAYRTPTGAFHYKHTSLDGRKKCKHAFPDPKVLLQYPAAADGTTIFDVPLRMRSATNPGGIGHEWYQKRFITPETKDEGAIFVPSLITDNPSIDAKTYIENLEHLTPVDRERLLNGDWNVTEEGDFFERHWFEPVDVCPTSKKTVRFWDMAATEPAKGKDPDWTVGAKLSLVNGRWYIEDIKRFQHSPTETERIIRATALEDGSKVPIRMEEEPGSAGITAISHYRRNILWGFNFDGIRSSGDKVTRAKPLASAARAENVFMQKAPWNKAFMDEAALFPHGAHDDIVDSLSSALEFLAFGKKARLVV